MNHAWTCHCCGQRFDTLPLSFACAGPDHWFQLPEAERDARGRLGSDVCIIGETDIFVRGCIEIPIIGHNDSFVWGVWVSVSEASFERIQELWDASEVENEPTKFGWLCNSLPLYPETLGLKTAVHLRKGFQRPFIELEPTDHPLAVEQRNGISLARVEQIAAALSFTH